MLISCVFRSCLLKVSVSQIGGRFVFITVDRIGNNAGFRRITEIDRLRTRCIVDDLEIFQYVNVSEF